MYNRLFNRIALLLTLALTPHCMSAPWQALMDGSNNGLNAQVSALTVHGGDLYVGGAFTSSGTEVINRIAKWDASGWSQLNQGIGDGLVQALAFDGGFLYAGGTFTTININGQNQIIKRIARWDPFASPATGWSPLGAQPNDGVGGTVYALAARAGRVYVGGDFTSAGGNTAIQKIGYWNGASWDGLSGNGGPGVADIVRSITVATDGTFYVGGNAGFFRKWTDAGGSGTWTTLSSVSGGDILALAIRDDKLWVGGSFNNAGGNHRRTDHHLESDRPGELVIPASFTLERRPSELHCLQWQRPGVRGGQFARRYGTNHLACLHLWHHRMVEQRSHGAAELTLQCGGGGSVCRTGLCGRRIYNDSRLHI